MSDSSCTNIKYDKPEMYEKFYNKLKEIDEEYRTTIINFNKYPIINFAMAKIMEMTREEHNQVALYLFNNIGITKKKYNIIFDINNFFKEIK